MAKISKADQGKADRATSLEYLRDTIGITEAQAAAWVKAERDYEAVLKHNRDSHAAMNVAIYDARIAKGAATGEDYPELTESEHAAIVDKYPRPHDDAFVTRHREALVKAGKPIAPLNEVFCICTHVAPSGMSRRIKLIMWRSRQPHVLAYNVARALGYRYHDQDGAVVIGGCGMDMGFALVSELSHKLFGHAGLLRHRWL